MDKSLVQGYTARAQLGFEPGLADSSAHNHGVASLGEPEGQGPAGNGDWLLVHGKPGPHWALQLVRVEKSEQQQALLMSCHIKQ